MKKYLTVLLWKNKILNIEYYTKIKFKWIKCEYYIMKKKSKYYFVLL